MAETKKASDDLLDRLAMDEELVTLKKKQELLIEMQSRQNIKMQDRIFMY